MNVQRGASRSYKLFACASAVWLAAWFALSLALSPAVLAAQPIQVQANAHDFQFGEQLRFRLQVQAEAPIQSIVLAYRTSDMQGTLIETMSFDPGTSVSVEHVHRVRDYYIRPFVEVTYWWTISTAAQDQLTTEPQTFVYADDRFDWQALHDGNLAVHWYLGDIESAQKALDVAVAGLNRARQDIHVESIHKTIDIYLYGSAADMRAALARDASTDVEALTLYETNVILVARPPAGENVLELRRVLPHEVTHALVHEATQSEFDRVPLWLSEGLATSVQYTFVPNPDARPLVEEAVRGRQMLALDTLCGAFPHDPSEVRLAYAESASVIDYIRDRYGRQGLRDLVAAYGDGATCRGGVDRVLGITLEQLLAQWSATLAPQNGWSTFWQENRAWITLLALSTLFPLAFVRHRRARTAPPGDRPGDKGAAGQPAATAKARSGEP
jgi:hypothetical protein